MKLFIFSFMLILPFAHADDCSKPTCTLVKGLWREAQGRIWEIGDDLDVKECVFAKNSPTTLICVGAKYPLLSQLAYDERYNNFYYQGGTFPTDLLLHARVTVDISGEHLSVKSHIFNLSFTRITEHPPIFEIDNPY